MTYLSEGDDGRANEDEDTVDGEPGKQGDDDTSPLVAITPLNHWGAVKDSNP